MLRKTGNFLRYLFGILMMLAGAGYWKEEKAYALSLLLLGIFLLPVTWNTIKKRFHVAKALPVLLPVLLLVSACALTPEPTIEAAAEETVETQAAEETQPAVTAEEPQVTEAPQESDPYGGQLVWISETGSKYHNKNNCGRMNPDRAYQMTRENAEAQGYEPCKKCF